MGWKFHRIWASEWFANPSTQADRIEQRWKEALAVTPPEPLREPTPAPAEPIVSAPRRGPRPPVEAGRGSITRYTDAELEALARWIESDGLPLDRATRLDQMRVELGFERRGPRITERCRLALDRGRG